MKPMVYLNVVSFYFCLTGVEMFKDENKFVPLIKRILNYYSASAIFLLYPETDTTRFDGIKILDTTHRLCRKLQREQIVTLSVRIGNMSTLTRYYGNILRPLNVIFLVGPRSFYEFTNNTRSIKMSSFAWFVIFLHLPTNKEFKYCYVPPGNPFNLSFDTEMLVLCSGDHILREWYSVDGDSTEIFELAKWYPDEHPRGSPLTRVDMLTNLSLYERRNNLKGKVLRGVTVKNSKLITAKGNKLQGYFSRAIGELESSLNFTLDIVAEMPEYGSFNVTTKRWSGAVSVVATGKVDIGVSDFSMTITRMDYVDYLLPIITSRNCLYMKQPEIFAVRWFAHYKTFSFTVWTSLFVVVMIAQVVLTFIRSRVDSCDMTRVVCDEFLRILGIFCQQGLTEFPRHSSLRLAYFTVFLTAVVMSAAYSASLICFLTAHVRDLPFRTIDEFIADEKHGIIVVRGTSDYDMFAYSKDPISVKIMKKLRPVNSLPLDVESGFKSICDDPKLAFYTSYNARLQRETMNLRVPCRTSCINFGRVDSLSLILSKESQYTELLNYHLQKLLNSGLLKRFKNDMDYQEENDFQPVGLGSVMSLLLIFFSGVALALLILIVEICYEKWKDIDDLDDRYR